VDGFRALEPERKPKRCWVRAKSEPEALAGTAELLFREVEELEVLSSRGGQFHVGLCFVDAQFTFGISEDHMEVVLLYIEADSEAQSPTLGTVTRQLSLAGVQFGYSEEGIKEVLASLEKGGLDQQTRLALGVPARPGQDGALEPLGELSGAVVFSGEAFARLIPKQEAADGQTLLGEILEAPAGKTTFSLVLGEGCVLDSVENQVTALFYGRPSINGGKVVVEPGLFLAVDGQTAKMEIGPTRLNGTPVSVADLRGALDAAGLDPECLELEGLRAGVKVAWEGQASEEPVLVAKARAPVPGRGEWLELLRKPDEMCFFDQPVMTVHPPSQSIPGKDIFGLELDIGEAPKEDPLEIGEGLSRPKGASTVKAAIPGRVRQDGNKVSLFPAVRVSPDGLSCLVDVPHLGAGAAPFDQAQLLAWLDDVGVVSEQIDQDALLRSLQLAASKKKVIENCMLAVGRPPTESWGAEYKALNTETRCAALPGDVLVEIKEPEPAKPGVTVMGTPIEAPPAGEENGGFLAGEGCQAMPGSIVASTYGRVVFERQSVSIEPGLKIHEKGYEARMHIFTKRIGGGVFEEEALVAFLLEKGIDSQCIDRELLGKALRGKKTRQILVARAVEPVQSQDAVLKSGGDVSGFPVFPGERVAWVEPASAGQPGKSILGEEIPPAREPIELQLDAGTYCELEEERFVVARAYGMARLVEEEPDGETPCFRVDIQPAIRVDKARQKCFMDVFPENMRGELVGVEALVEVLREAGVVDQGIDRKALSKALAMAAGKVQKNVLVAQGQKPSAGEDWSVVCLADSRRGAVFPGEAIAEIRARSPGSAGWDLEGNPIPMEEAEVGLSLHTRSHCGLSEDGRQALAEVYGRPDVEGISVRVLPGLRVGPSDFSLRMDIFPTRSDGTRITERDLLEQLTSLDIPEDFFRHDALLDALRVAWASNQPQWHIEVARGDLPEKGRDGAVEAVGDHSQGCVFPGDVVAKVVPEVAPKAGKTVFGAPIPAPGPVRAAKVTPEVGCELRNQVEVVATQYGRPFVDGKKVLVQSSLYLATDGMRVAMDLFSKRSNGEEVDADTVVQLLRGRGISEEFIDPMALKAGLIEAKNRGGIYWDFEVALGVEPASGKDGRAERVGEGEGCVFPGETFAHFHPHEPGSPGKTVDGRPVPPSEEPQKIRLLQGEGTKISPDGLEAIAEVYGEPDLQDTLASIKAGIRVDRDQMAAFMDIWPTRASGEPVTVEVVKAFLLSAGFEEVCIELSEITEALGKAVASAQVVRDVCVAKGAEPVSGSDGATSFSADLENACVFPGDVVGKLILPVLAQPGLTVMGKKLSTEEGVREFKFATKEGIRFDPSTLELLAEVYGHLSLSRGRVTERAGSGVNATEQVEVGVVPGLVFNETGLACRMNIFPQNITGGVVEVGDLKKVLRAAGVSEERILVKVLAGARKAAARQWRPQMGITVAKGVYPRHGRDGSIEVAIEVAGQAGEAGAFGRMDFREQKSFVEVSPGMTLATLSMPSEGHAGMTVRGETIDARDGKEGTLETGSGVEIEDGVVKSLRQGVLTIRGNFIDVVELLVIEGDVDYSTGNVKVKSGSVRITGSVHPGFEVICPDDVEVGEVVEGATITAGGNVLIRGGVVVGAGTECTVVAGGEINVGLARNAKLKAKGDLLVQKELLHCEVEIEGRLLADRKPGLVSGGKIKARKGAVVCLLGSPQWTPTVIHVGGTIKRVSELQRELGSLRRQRTRLNDRLGGKSDGEALSACSPMELSMVEAVCAQREGVRAEIVQMEAELAELVAKFDSESAAIVVVKESLYPRVVLNFPQGQFNAEVQVSRARFFYNTQENKVEYLDIGTDLPDFLGLGEEEG
jgi:uncharacterized protein (DUF342 family)